MPYGNFTSGVPFNIPVDVFAWPVFITARRDPTTNDIQNPGTRWMNEITSNIFETTGSGNWLEGGVGPASTTEYGTVLLTDNSQPVATKVYVDNIAIAGAPVATETVAGIGQLATDVEAIAGTPSTGALALFVTPSNLAPVLAAGSIPGSFTDLTATGTVSFTGATGGITMTSSTASSFGTTGAGIDLTLDSAAGRVIINAEESADNAITLLSAAGGVDIDGALQVNIASSEAAGDALRLVASAGGIDIDAVGSAGVDINMTNTGGSIFLVATESATDAIKLDATAGGIKIFASGSAAGEDIEIAATGSSVIISSTENDAGAIYLHADGGASERIRLHSDQGTGVDSIILESDVGGLTLSSGLASADAINLSASAGGVDIDGALQVNIASSQNAVDAIRIVASAGGIDIDAVGAATEDINITNTGGSVVVTATESVADAVRINASGAASGIDIDAGTGGFLVDTTGAISLDAAAASNFTATGAFDLTLQSTAGSVIVSASEDAADALQLLSTAGGIDILSTGAAGQDIDVINTGGSINVTATENDAGAIYIRANGGTSERIRLHSDQGTAVDSILVESDVGGLTLSSGLASDDAINLSASAGGVDIDGALQVNIATSEAAGDALRLIASAGGIDIDAVGSAGVDINMTNTGGSIFLIATEDAVDAIKLEASNGGIQIVAPSAAAGEDIAITATGSSVAISSTENVGDAIVLNASGAASGVDISAGTGSIHLNSGLIVKVTDVVNADSPYTVLGTDYFISVDTSGGAVTVTLPAATAVTGQSFVIRDSGGAAAASNITINGGGTNLVGGGAASATKTISAAYAGATVYSNGTTWNYVAVA